MATRPPLAAVALLLVACNDTSFFVKGDPEPAGPAPGAISGRVCDPSGRNWLADAVVYTHLFDATGTLTDTRQVFSDRDGRWILEELPPYTTYTVYVQFGDAILDELTVEVGDGDFVELDEPDCFDPLELDVAVITGDYDEFDRVLDNMGFANYTLVDGLDVVALTDFLGDPAALAAFDIIFFNGGFVEAGVIYSLEDAFADPTLMQNVRDYVEGGGSIYASDWAYDVIEVGWPDKVEFVGDDLVPDAAQVGEYDLVNASVADAALSDWLGSSTLTIEYDLPVWPPIESTSASVTTHLSGGVAYRVGTETYNLADVPLMVSFTAGEGKVVFSTFRVARNGSQDMLEVLQYIMYNL